MEPLLRLTLLAKTKKICFKQFGRVFLQAALRKNRMLMALAMRLFCESHLNETAGAVKMQQIQRFSSLSFHSLNSFPFPQSYKKVLFLLKSSLPACAFLKRAAKPSVHRRCSVHRVYTVRSGSPGVDLTSHAKSPSLGSKDVACGEMWIRVDHVESTSQDQLEVYTIYTIQNTSPR